MGMWPFINMFAMHAKDSVFKVHTKNIAITTTIIAAVAAIMIDKPALSFNK